MSHLKRQVINLRSCCILLVDSVEIIYQSTKTYNARRPEHFHISVSLLAILITKYLCSVPFIIISLLYQCFNPLNPELNPIFYLLALLAHHFLPVSRIRVKSLTIRLLTSYIYMERLFLMFLDHTQRRTSR